MDVSVVIPMYNEQENVEPTLTKLCRVLDSSGRKWEIVVVDDGSDDNTMKKAKTPTAKMIKETTIVIIISRQEHISTHLSFGVHVTIFFHLITLVATRTNIAVYKTHDGHNGAYNQDHSNNVEDTVSSGGSIINCSPCSWRHSRSWNIGQGNEEGKSHCYP